MNARRRRVLVTGASGYVGGRLIPELLARGYAVRAMARDRTSLAALDPSVEKTTGDVLDPSTLATSLDGVEFAYYLIHSMRGHGQDFEQRDRTAAANFAAAAAAAGVKRIVYLGGLGETSAALSTHLRSRHEVGEILRAGGVPVTELRAAMVVGSGSASFLMMRYLTDRLPLMITPKWVATRCQPIAVDDVLRYLVGALSVAGGHRTYEVGGPDVLTYADMMLRYAALRGWRRYILTVPFFSPRLSSYWVRFVTPVPASVARSLIDGLSNELIVRDATALRDFAFSPMGYEESLRAALRED